MLKRIMVTGTSGLLGSRIVKLAEKSFEVIPTHHTCPFFKESIKMDMINGHQLGHAKGCFRANIQYCFTQ